ncbi:YhbY family RNA-binding protein [Candidatus Pacearchaeota archaeon]|nr:hypothetical protein [uncultured archaeon]AQS33207.1 hypothetical protein [uncultured archaeon]MBS3091571.1 YhbY family RNA-binding protein [Candidatus Pacearchaeota archaeon]
MITETKFQIGKNGITGGVIEGLNNALKTHKRIRIAVLKSSGRDRDSIQEMAKSIQSKLDVHCEFRIIGFTIILRRQAGKNKDKV